VTFFLMHTKIKLMIGVRSEKLTINWFSRARKKPVMRRNCTSGTGGKESSRVCYAEKLVIRKTTNGVRREMLDQRCMAIQKLMLRLCF